MKTSSILTIVAAIAAVAVAAVIASGRRWQGEVRQRGAPAASAPPAASSCPSIVSPEKEELLKAVVAKFNRPASRSPASASSSR